MTITIDTIEQWHNIMPAGQLSEGMHHVVLIKNHPIALFNLNGQFYAIEDSCPHQGLPLSDGKVEKDEITCPFHGAKFNIKTGAVTSPPAFENLRTFEVRLEGEMIQVKV